MKKWRIFMKKWRIFPYAVIFWFLNHFFKNHMHRSPPSNCRHFATVQKGSHIDPFNIWPMSDAPGDIRELKSRQWSCSTLQGGMSYLEEQRRLVKEEHLDIEDQLKVTCQLCSCVVHFLIRFWILSFPIKPPLASPRQGCTRTPWTFETAAPGNRSWGTEVGWRESGPSSQSHHATSYSYWRVPQDSRDVRKRPFSSLWYPVGWGWLSSRQSGWNLWQDTFFGW